MSIRDNSFFKESNLSLGNLFWLMYLWLHCTPVQTAEGMLAIGDDTVWQWYQYFWDVCSNFLVVHPFQIGGPGITVQIDELVIAKQKYNCGHCVPERWVFGGYNCTSKLGFLVEVKDQSATTLLLLIQQHIACLGAPSTVTVGLPIENLACLVSQCCHKLCAPNSENHTHNFVDPVTHAHTQQC